MCMCMCMCVCVCVCMWCERRGEIVLGSRAKGVWLHRGVWRAMRGERRASGLSAKILERPKSVILTTASSVVSLSSRFSGLRSRCAMPISCR